MNNGETTGRLGLAREFARCPLAEQDERFFSALVAECSEIVQLAVEETVLRVDRKVFPRLSAMARRTGERDAVPQDLIAVHLSSLAVLIRNKPHTLTRACIRHSRLLLVKMIGELALYYRDRALRDINAKALARGVDY